MKIDQQPRANPGEFHVGKQLGAMNGHGGTGCFYFNNHALFDNNIGAKSGLESQTVVNDWDRRLSDCVQPALRYLVSQADLVDRFQQPFPSAFETVMAAAMISAVSGSPLSIHQTVRARDCGYSD